MEKPNPELYNSEGHYEADLEKYNEMKTAEAKNFLRGYIVIGDKEMEKTVIEVMESYAAQFKAEPSQSKPVFHGKPCGKLKYDPVNEDIQIFFTEAEQTQPAQCAGVKPNWEEDFKEWITNHGGNEFWESWDKNLPEVIISYFKRYVLIPQQQYAVSDEEIEKMVDDAFSGIRSVNGNAVGINAPGIIGLYEAKAKLIKHFKAALRKQVWDCSDIAVKYHYWLMDNEEWYEVNGSDMWQNMTTNETKSTSALYSYWFNEIYNKK